MNEELKSQFPAVFNAQVVVNSNDYNDLHRKINSVSVILDNIYDKFTNPLIKDGIEIDAENYSMIWHLNNAINSLDLVLTKIDLDSNLDEK